MACVGEGDGAALQDGEWGVEVQFCFYARVVQGIRTGPGGARGQGVKTVGGGDSFGRARTRSLLGTVRLSRARSASHRGKLSGGSAWPGGLGPDCSGMGRFKSVLWQHSNSGRVRQILKKGFPNI
jgi:hypothetical protein